MIGFQEDESWREVGNHLFFQLIPAIVLGVGTDSLVSAVFGGTWWWPGLAMAGVGLNLGDRLWHWLGRRGAREPDDAAPVDSAQP